MTCVHETTIAGCGMFFSPILRRPAGAFKQGHDLSSLAGHVSNVCRGKENRRFTTQMQMRVYIYTYGYGSIPINTIFRGMNIHLPAILMFTRGTRF